jgi:hypothetical protein
MSGGIRVRRRVLPEPADDVEVVLTLDSRTGVIALGPALMLDNRTGVIALGPAPLVLRREWAIKLATEILRLSEAVASEVR